MLDVSLQGVVHGDEFRIRILETGSIGITHGQFDQHRTLPLAPHQDHGAPRRASRPKPPEPITGFPALARRPDPDGALAAGVAPKQPIDCTELGSAFATGFGIPTAHGTMNWVNHDLPPEGTGRGLRNRSELADVL